MLQFYFLSICLNSIAGLILILNKTQESQAENINNIANNYTFKLIIGILCCFTGFIKLLTSFPGSIPIIGDLLPSVVGVLGGIALLIDYYVNNPHSQSKINPKLETIFITNKKYIGIICFLSALLHFLFPRVIIL